MPDPEKTCFVIAPIGELDSDVRRRSDQVLRHIIQPAAQQAGYEAIRADQISEPGIITTQVIQHIIEDGMVVADLTGRNPNVFYELAIRHALRKPYVQIIERGEGIPFDVANIRTIEVDHHDLDSVELAKAEITRQMRAMQAAGRSVDSPISVAVDLDVLRRSGNPEQRQLADVLTSLTELKTIVGGFGERLERVAGMEAARAADLSRVVHDLWARTGEIGIEPKPGEAWATRFRRTRGSAQTPKRSPPAGGAIVSISRGLTGGYDVEIRGKGKRAVSFLRTGEKLLHFIESVGWRPGGQALFVDPKQTEVELLVPMDANVVYDRANEIANAKDSDDG